MNQPVLTIAIDGCQPSFEPRARWILQEFATALGRTAEFVAQGADLVYAPQPTGAGIWIPANRDAQAFFDHSIPRRALCRAY